MTGRGDDEERGAQSGLGMIARACVWIKEASPAAEGPRSGSLAAFHSGHSAGTHRVVRRSVPGGLRRQGALFADNRGKLGDRRCLCLLRRWWAASRSEGGVSRKRHRHRRPEEKSPLSAVAGYGFTISAEALTRCLSFAAPTMYFS